MSSWRQLNEQNLHHTRVGGGLVNHVQKQANNPPGCYHATQYQRGWMNWLMTLAAFFARLLPAPVKRLLYRIPVLSNNLRRVLNRAAPVGMSQAVVAAGELKGFSLMLDLQSEKDYWLGTYELELQAALHKLVKPGMTAYDVGANIGYISLILARLVGETGRVYAFEALPANTQRWKTNVELNGLSDRMHLFSGAVSNSTAPVHFLVHNSGGMGKVVGSAGRENTYQNEIEVPGTTLDDFIFNLGNPSPQVIKIDIEGGEVLALPGMRHLLAEKRPILLMELHGHESSQVVWQILTGLGYSICWMESGFPRVTALEELEWKAYLVALPESR
jgi:FkbM family methyltransferase